MINLSDHSCYHCKHLNRYERTLHGGAVDAWNRYDHLISEQLEKNDFSMIPYYRKRRDECFEAMRYIESGEHQRQWRHVTTYKHHHAK